MRISELVSNSEFNFNVPFRIVKYIPEDDECITMYESEQYNNNIPINVFNKWITAINEGDDGVLEIEYIELLGG